MPVLKKPSDAKTSNRAHPTPYLIGGLQITAIPCAAAHYPPMTVIVYSITKKDFILTFKQTDQLLNLHSKYIRPFVHWL